MFSWFLFNCQFFFGGGGTHFLLNSAKCFTQELNYCDGGVRGSLISWQFRFQHINMNKKTARYLEGENLSRSQLEFMQSCHIDL